jgi:hypothetical protein
MWMSWSRDSMLTSENGQSPMTVLFDVSFIRSSSTWISTLTSLTRSGTSQSRPLKVATPPPASEG